MGPSKSALPKWFKLLRYQKYGRGRTGLTIPLLIGADRPTEAPEMDEGAAHGELTSLLLSLRDAVHSGYCVAIAECDDLHQPIVALHSAGRPPARCDAVIGGSNERAFLYVQKDYFASKKRSLESAAEGLWKLVGSHLMRGEFSFVAGSYGPFGAGDRAFIASAESWAPPTSRRTVWGKVAKQPRKSS
jgi:hypothetical protein